MSPKKKFNAEQEENLNSIRFTSIHGTINFLLARKKKRDKFKFEGESKQKVFHSLNIAQPHIFRRVRKTLFWLINFLVFYDKMANRKNPFDIPNEHSKIISRNIIYRFFLFFFCCSLRSVVVDHFCQFLFNAFRGSERYGQIKMQEENKKTRTKSKFVWLVFQPQLE